MDDAVRTQSKPEIVGVNLMVVNSELNWKERSEFLCQQLLWKLRRVLGLWSEMLRSFDLKPRAKLFKTALRFGLDVRIAQSSQINYELDDLGEEFGFFLACMIKPTRTALFLLCLSYTFPPSHYGPDATMSILRCVQNLCTHYHILICRKMLSSVHQSEWKWWLVSPLKLGHFRWGFECLKIIRNEIEYRGGWTNFLSLPFMTCCF